METETEIIKQILLQFFPTCVILLFGSRARNDYTEDSDFDLLVITKDNLSISQKRDYKAKIRKLLARRKIPVDILIQGKQEIETKQKITGHIVKQALKEGVRI